MQSIALLAVLMRRGATSPTKILDECLSRIELLEEQIHAWVFLDIEGAKAEAVRLERELADGHDRGPLHGIPIGVKDIFDVADWPTAAGSKRWANSIARNDCPLVAQLRNAGAILLGKTVTTAYASFDPPITKNPWNPSRTPGGSSSGSAAAVACGMCVAALGSQTGGSITRPASYCGVCGFKPTHGTFSLEGVVPLAPSLDHAGFIAGCVDDLRILYQTMLSEPTTPLADEQRDNTSIGVPTGIFADRLTPVMRSEMDQLKSHLMSSGWELVDVELPQAFRDVPKNHRMMMAVQAAMYHEKRLARYPEDYPPRITSLLQEGFRTPAPDYARMYEHRQRLIFDMDDWLADEGMMLLTPATMDPAPDASTTGDPLFNSPWSYLGLPTVSFPFTWTKDGLPLCVQLVGAKDSEISLLNMASDLEADIECETRVVNRR